MQKLDDYVRNRTIQVELGAGDVDVGFFGVKVLEGTDKEQFAELVEDSVVGAFTSIDVLNAGRVLNYIELGGWIGDMGIALCFMAMGTHLGLFKMLSPDELMPNLTDDLKKEMLGMGMLSIYVNQ